MFKCASIGSGSKGNGSLIATQSTLILVDCGFSMKETITRLAKKGVEPNELSAILVTHEHSDHSGGVARFARKFNLPVYLSRGTALHSSCRDINNINWIESEQVFLIGDIEVLPFVVPHDAREPLQFRFTSHDAAIGLLTDLGHITSHVTDALKDVGVLLMEFNHDLKMLESSRYPEPLKQRISGGFGHLNNEQSLALVKSNALSQLRTVVAMHLSEENNCPKLVNDLLSEVCSDILFTIADQKAGFEWIHCV